MDGWDASSSKQLFSSDSSSSTTSSSSTSSTTSSSSTSSTSSSSSSSCMKCIQRTRRSLLPSAPSCTRENENIRKASYRRTRRAFFSSYIPSMS
ncbi:MAG: hypothetical protein E7278_02020 [Lachnospiraceae bacterium]|nr:hypothetical protein [Lachnospiraceae bacterium]